MFDNNFTPNNEETPPLKILLADDDDSIRRFIEIILQRENYEVIATSDGLEALNAALENRFDAIIADAIMPNLTGFDLCRILRQNPNYQDVPFIILSGLEHKIDASQADAYLLKENNIKENLINTLSHLIINRELLVDVTG